MNKKRFIAGAICPLCKEIDSLRWGHELQMEVIECVKCTHIERRALTPPESISDQTPEDLIAIFKLQ